MPADAVAPKNRPLSSLRGLTADEVARLAKQGITRTAELLVAAPSLAAERRLAEKTGLSRGRVREAVNRAELAQVMGPVTADLFENAGVNGLGELAHRRPENLTRDLTAYVRSRPELNYRAPSLPTVTRYVDAARELWGAEPGVVTPPDTAAPTEALAKDRARAALVRHLDEVLFSNHPDGESFRDAVVGWRTPEGQAELKAEMRREIEAFLGLAPSAAGDSSLEEVMDRGDHFLFVGRWIGLYTELPVRKSDGQVARVYVEID